jgi:hypothetical protein
MQNKICCKTFATPGTKLLSPEIFQETANKEIHLDDCFLYVDKIRRFDPSLGLTAFINRIQETSSF